jgi:hypothetical protein
VKSERPEVSRHDFEDRLQLFEVHLWVRWPDLRGDRFSLAEKKGRVCGAPTAHLYHSLPIIHGFVHDPLVFPAAEAHAVLPCIATRDISCRLVGGPEIHGSQCRRWACSSSTSPQQ